MLSKYTCILISLGLLTLFACVSRENKNVIRLPVKTDPTISVKIWFKVGSQNDPAGKEGLAVMTSALLAEGSTKKNKYDEILKRLYPMAAGYSASVDKEMTVFHGRVHRDKLDSYLQLYTEAILEPAFDKDDFERIKSNTINDLEKSLRYGNDEAFGKEALYQFVFEGTPYGHPNLGLIKSVKDISLEDVKDFYGKHYTIDNLVIGLGGGFNAGIEKRLEKAFSVLPQGQIETAPILEPKSIDGLQVLLIDKDTKSTAISFGFPVDVHRGEKDFCALWLARSWFGEHRNSSSHLYQVIRETRGLNYGDYCYVEYFPSGWATRFPNPNVARRQQLFEVWIRPVPNTAAHFALRAAVRELQKLVDDGMTQEQFDLTKKFLSKYYLHYAATTSEKLGYKLDDQFYGIRDHLKALPKELDRLTLADVNAAIKKHLQYKNIKIAMITQNAEKLKNALLADSPSPMKYATPKPLEVLEEDKLIEKYPLKIKAENLKVVKSDQMFLQ
jgi:zinc protease